MSERSSKRWMAAALAVAVVSGSTWTSAAESQSPGREETSILVPTPDLSLKHLERWVSEHSPQVAQATLDVRLAKADVTKARLLPNPTLDVAWATVPVGPTNPADLPHPYANIPNYSLGLAYTVPLGKRGPLRERAQALELLATRALQADVRGRAITAAEVLGELATATLRTQGLEELVQTSQDFVSVTSQRVAAQSSPGIDLDRVQLELARVEQSVVASRAEQLDLLSRCAAIAGGRCAAFESADVARAFLNNWIAQVPASNAFSERPDVVALQAQSQAAVAEAKWARTLKIPDPTVRVGYVRDQFVVAGNQLNSLNLSVALPLTLFDHGQAEAEAAVAKAEQARHQQQRLVDVTTQRLLQLRTQLAQQQERHTTLQNQVLPHARAVLDNLDDAAKRGLVSIADVILARRTVVDVVIDETDSLGTTFTIALSLMAELNPSK